MNKVVCLLALVLCGFCAKAQAEVHVGVGINIHGHHHECSPCVPRCHDYCRPNVFIGFNYGCGYWSYTTETVCVCPETVEHIKVIDSWKTERQGCHVVTVPDAFHYEDRVIPARYENRTYRIWVQD